MIPFRFFALAFAVMLFLADLASAGCLAGRRQARRGNQSSCSGQSRVRLAIRTRGTVSGCSSAQVTPPSLPSTSCGSAGCSARMLLRRR
jgi:hypothetical protein